MRPDDGYERCGPGCGCCADSQTDPPEEQDDGYPDDMPDDITPGERLLWAIFGKQPTEDEQ